MLFTIGEMMTGAGSAIAGLMVAYAMFQNYFPYDLRKPLKRYSHRIMNFFYPYIVITFPEFQGDGFERSKAFAAIERYLNKNSSKQAKHLQANVVQDSQAIVLSMADNEDVTDEFQGIKLWWASDHFVPDRQSISLYPREDANRYFTLTLHKKYRDIITNSYKRTKWSHAIFEHPASFDTLGMDPNKKEEIVKDLIRFTEAKDYYVKIGKAWKRGYLLYGPPGTGKSTMIAAVGDPRSSNYQNNDQQTRFEAKTRK